MALVDDIEEPIEDEALDNDGLLELSASDLRNLAEELIALLKMELRLEGERRGWTGGM